MGCRPYSLMTWQQSSKAISSGTRTRRCRTSENTVYPSRRQPLFSPTRIWRTPMPRSARRRAESEIELVRVLGRGLRAARGIHLTLRTLREAAGKTQVDVAKRSRSDQADVSRL